MKKKPLYIPPAFAASDPQWAFGQTAEPMGICTPGSTIQDNYTCARGDSPPADPSTCSIGTNPTLGGCSKGNYAESFCETGASD